jgi:hypothetical protein
MSPPVEAPDTPRLEYAPAAPARRRKRVVRAALAVALLALLYVGWRHGAAIRDQAKVLYFQRQCLKYSPGPNIVVFDNGSSDAQKLAAQPGYQLLVGRMRRSQSQLYAGHVPPCWTNLIAAVPALAKLSPANRAAVVFCHELTSRAGVRRLVIIERGVEWPHYPYNPLNLDVVMMEPTGLTGQPIDRTPTYPNIIYTGATAIEPVPLYIFAGQPDPSDAAHFTIRYRVGANAEHTVDGRLKDDASDVTLTFRTPAGGI